MIYRISTRTVFFALALPALVLTATVARSEIIEQILVKVNGEILTKTDLETRQVQALRQKGQNIDLASEKGNTELRKALNEITPGLLVSSVDEMLLVQRGKELGYKLSDEQFKRVLDNLKTQNKIETDEQLQAALKQEGMTMTDLRRNMERQMLYSNVQQVEVFGLARAFVVVEHVKADADVRLATRLDQAHRRVQAGTKSVGPAELQRQPHAKPGRPLRRLS